MCIYVCSKLSDYIFTTFLWSFGPVMFGFKWLFNRDFVWSCFLNYLIYHPLLVISVIFLFRTLRFAYSPLAMDRNRSGDPPASVTSEDASTPDSDRGPSITTSTTTTITTTTSAGETGSKHDRMSVQSSNATLRPITTLPIAMIALLMVATLLPVSLMASNVRSTKNYDFKETDGSSPGFIMFNLDKIHASEVFKMETPNRWVSVDVTGAVRVKEPWDYEQLSKDKTIDFWVIITSPSLNGEYTINFHWFGKRTRFF